MNTKKSILIGSFIGLLFGGVFSQITRYNTANQTVLGNDNVTEVIKIGEDILLNQTVDGDFNITTTIKDGNFNKATQIQGMLYAENDDALINQEGDNNEAYQKWKYNKANIKQYGNNNIAKQEQTSNETTVDGDGNYAKIYQGKTTCYVVGNEACQEQKGERDTVIITQSGDENFESQYQKGDKNYADVYKTGNSNLAIVEQTGNDNDGWAKIKQVSNKNYDDIDQWNQNFHYVLIEQINGDENTASVYKAGGDNNFSITIQNGSLNESDIVQDGDSNTALNYELGIGNSSKIWQDGFLNCVAHTKIGDVNNAITTTKGNRNDALVVQGITEWKQISTQILDANVNRCNNTY